ncbi:MAG: M16 family metallopeptidase [Parvularculaceae bacterium]
MAELFHLSNGVRVFVDPMDGLESAALGVWVRAGAIDETPEESGVAHLLEHMAFKGTKTRTARRIAEEIENVGGYLNASTGYSRTGYYARVLRNDVGMALTLLADILTDPLLDETELAKEREVVIQEIGEAADAPEDAVMELIQTLCFQNHALGRPILGTVETVQSHTRTRLGGFMTKHYAPEDIVIAASGAVSTEDILRQSENLFAARAPVRRNSRTQRPQYIGGAEHDAREIEQTHIALAFPGAAVRDADFFATRIYSECLGGGMSSRIFQSVREERGLAYSVYSFADSYDETGVVGVYVGADAKNTPEAISLIRREMHNLAASPTKAEIERARVMLKSTMLMGLESPSTRTETAVGQLFSHGRLISPAEISERLDDVNADDVRAVAQKAASCAAPSIAIVGPADFEAAQKSLIS